MLTRDSWLWKVLFWGGSGIAALAEIVVMLDPASAASIGLSPDTMARFRVLYAIVIGVSGKLGLSLLDKSQSQPSGDVVKPSRFLGLLLILALALSAPACGGKAAAVTLPTVPAVALSDLARFAQRVEQAGEVAKQAQQLEIGIASLGLIDQDLHASIQRGFLALAVSVQAAVDVAKTTVDAQSAAAALQGITAALERINQAALRSPNATVRSVITAMTGTIRVLLLLEIGHRPLPGEALADRPQANVGVERATAEGGAS